MVSIAARVGAVGVVALTMGLTACEPTPAGSGGLVGRMMGISDVAGTSDYAIGGGGLAILPIEVMEGPFWEVTGAQPIADPQEWNYLGGRLSESDVSQLGGMVTPIEEDGDFRITAPPGEYAVCYWLQRIGGEISGCSRLELPHGGELMASWGEAGFEIAVRE